MATPDEVKQVWHLLHINYIATKESDAETLRQQLQLWQRLLTDIPGPVLKAAALQHMATSKWFPTVAELRDWAGTIQRPVLPTAMDGWGEVVAALADVRYYRYADGYHAYPTFSPVTQRVVDAMGWSNLAGSEDATADRARFLQAYEIMAQRAMQEQGLLPDVRTLMAQHQPALDARTQAGT